MSKYSSSEDIYKKLVDESEEDWLYNLVAFAIIEEKRIEWMRHSKENNGDVPDAETIIHWYEQQPDSVLTTAKGEAEAALKNFSNDVVEEVLSEERAEIKDGIIVKEIQMLRRIWPQVGINMLGGFISALVFSAFLVFITVFVLNDTSPVELGNKIKTQIEERKKKKKRK